MGKGNSRARVQRVHLDIAQSGSIPKTELSVRHPAELCGR